MTRFALFLLACLSTLTLGACSAHQVRGVVVVGQQSSVQLVHKSDPRLEGEPVAGANISAIIDPQSLDRSRLPAVLSDPLGAFAIPVDEFGAGWLDYELGILARRDSFAPAEGFVKLPGGDTRVLIVLAPGRDTHRSGDSAYDEDWSADRQLERFAH